MKEKKFQAGSKWARELRATLRPAWHAMGKRAVSGMNFSLHLSDELRRVVKPRRGEHVKHRLPLETPFEVFAEELETPFEVFAEDPANREAMQRALAKVDKIPAKQWRISRTIGNLAIRGQNSQRRFCKYGRFARAPGSNNMAVEKHGALAEAMDAVPAGETIGTALTGRTEEAQHEARQEELAEAAAAQDAALGAAAQAAARAHVELEGAIPDPIAMESIRRGNLTKAQLEAELGSHELSSLGTKRELLVRLTQHLFLKAHSEEVKDQERMQEVRTAALAAIMIAPLMTKRASDDLD